VARHSKQIPIAQSGARGSPVTNECANAPALRIAVATIEPSETCICLPFNVIEIVEGRSGILIARRESFREIWLDRDERLAPRKLIGKQSGSGEGSGDAEPLVPSCEKESRIV
jgi:hypothetical protein